MSGHNTSSQQPKLSQIARLAGVSVTTASRALRGKGRINEQTVIKVRTVAQMLGYPTKPDTVAEHKASLVAVITHPPSQLAGSDGVEQTHTFWFRMFYGVINRLTGKGSGVVWATTDSQNLLIPLPVSAIVLGALSVPRPQVIDLGYHVPIIVSGNPDPSDDPRIQAYVGYDNEQAAKDACEHLTESGASKLAVVARPSVGVPAAQWIAGLEQWCSEHDQESTVIRDEADLDQLIKQVKEAIDNGIDGFFVAMPSPVATIQAIRQTGKSIPDDIQVVTWQEAIDSHNEIPEFTKIAPKAFDASEVVAETIERMIDGVQQQQVHLDYELIQGRSTRSV